MPLSRVYHRQDRMNGENSIRRTYFGAPAVVLVVYLLS
jgi:hypothetical protein